MSAKHAHINSNDPAAVVAYERRLPLIKCAEPGAFLADLKAQHVDVVITQPPVELTRAEADLAHILRAAAR